MHAATCAPQRSPLRRGISEKDIVPLIDDHELEEYDKGAEDVVEVVLAVTRGVEGGSAELGVAAVRHSGIVVPEEADLVLEELHADHGVHIVHRLDRD